MRSEKMIEKKIRAKKDFTFTNFSGTYRFIEGEVKKLQFLNTRVFKEHLKSGWMVEVDGNEKEEKNIPVVHPPVSEDAIVSVEPVDLVDPPEGIEPDKPDLPRPVEDHIKETPVEILRDVTRSEPLVEEVVPERVEEAQPEIREFELNAETVQAVEEFEKGQDLHSVDTPEELISELHEEDVTKQ